MLPFAEAWPIVRNIPGWLDIEDAKVLFDLCSNLTGDRTIIEVGTYCGRSAVLFALGCKHPILCVDPMVVGVDDANHMTISEMDVLTLEENIRHYPQIAWLRMYSKEVYIPSLLPRSFGMIYIDANHQYPNPKQDYLAFHSHLRPGAVVAFHDYGTTYPGVKQSIRELEDEGLIFNGRPTGGLYVANRSQ